MKKPDGFNFREILKSKARGLKPQVCRSLSSPVCLQTFIVTREEQTMCRNCLVFNDLLGAHPVIKVKEIGPSMS